MATLLSKALRGVLAQPERQPRSQQPEARGTVSGWVMGVSPLWGQPYPEQVDQTGDAASLISRERMREVVLRTPTAAACLNAILDFAGGVKIGVRNVDAAEKISKSQSKKIMRVLNKPNPNQTRRQFILTLMRDIVTFGYGAVELVPTGKPDNPVDMWVMDSARLKIDFDEHGLIRGYDMLNARGIPIVEPGTGGVAQPGNSVNYEFPSGPGIGATGQPSFMSYRNSPMGYSSSLGANLHGWNPSEVIFFSLNPISESIYPHSRIVQLFSAALLEDLMIQFIGERFTDSNIPFGVFDLGDVSDTELRAAIDNWNTQGKAGNRILMTGSRGSGSKWIPFGYHLKDLEATKLLEEFRLKIMGILGVTMQELASSQDVSKSNGYNLSFTFKKRAIEPLLDEITETLTHRLIHDTLHYEDAELYYEEIDSRDDFLMSQIDTNYEKLGILSPNEIRNRKGLTSIPGGDEPILYTGNSWLPMSMVHDFAKQMIVIEESTATVGATGAGGMRVRETIPANNLTNQGTATVPRETATGGGPGQAGGGGGAKPVGVTNGHNRGKSSEMGRQLTGKSDPKIEALYRLLFESKDSS